MPSTCARLCRRALVEEIPGHGAARVFTPDLVADGNRSAAGKVPRVTWLEQANDFLRVLAGKSGGAHWLYPVTHHEEQGKVVRRAVKQGRDEINCPVQTTATPRDRRRHGWELRSLVDKVVERRLDPIDWRRSPQSTEVNVLNSRESEGRVGSGRRSRR